MVSEIRLYVEGDTALRAGFGQFLESLRKQARDRRKRWYITMCASRQLAYRDYCIGLRANPDAFNILLVDSEANVTAPPWEHLRRRHGDNWQKPDGCTDEHCHLMVQAMEAWFLADRETLQSYFGQGFQANALPALQNIENIAPSELERILQHSVRNTHKQEYRKIRDGAALLSRVKSVIVRQHVPSCERLFVTIERLLHL